MSSNGVLLSICDHQIQQFFIMLSPAPVLLNISNTKSTNGRCPAPSRSKTPFDVKSLRRIWKTCSETGLFVSGSGRTDAASRFGAVLQAPAPPGQSFLLLPLNVRGRALPRHPARDENCNASTGTDTFASAEGYGRVSPRETGVHIN